MFNTIHVTFVGRFVDILFAAFTILLLVILESSIKILKYSSFLQLYVVGFQI